MPFRSGASSRRSTPSKPAGWWLAPPAPCSTTCAPTPTARWTSDGSLIGPVTKESTTPPGPNDVSDPLLELLRPEGAYRLVWQIPNPDPHLDKMRVPPEEFEALVEQALGNLPDEFKEALDNVAVMIAEEPSDEDLEEVGIDPDDPDRDELFGLYHGTPLTERDSFYSALPDRVMIYRGPILRECTSRREVMREVRETVQHELGHYFGMEEDDLPF